MIIINDLQEKPVEATKQKEEKRKKQKTQARGTGRHATASLLL
jgi:hypothetical protein